MKTIMSFVLTIFSTIAFSQVTSIPPAARDNFAKQYPNAQNVTWDNDVINVNVWFELNGEQMDAEYSNKGIWKSTLKDWTFDQLPAEVKDGFQKSKYADREVEETKIMYLPGDIVQYRIKAKKNGVEKKYLYFNDKGRLVRDAVTL
jgi:hypothetical protein